MDLVFSVFVIASAKVASPASAGVVAYDTASEKCCAAAIKSPLCRARCPSNRAWENCCEGSGRPDGRWLLNGAMIAPRSSRKKTVSRNGESPVRLEMLF